MLTEQDFIKGMSVLMAAYPDYECSPTTVDIYRERLRSKFTPWEWEAAVNRHIDTCKWFPKISELLKAAQDLLPSPLEVWNRLLNAAEDGEKPEMDAATECALAAIGGWEVFSYSPYEALHYRFKEFKAAYLEAQQHTGTIPEIESSGKPPLQIEH